MNTEIPITTAQIAPRMPSMRFIDLASMFDSKPSRIDRVADVVADVWGITVGHMRGKKKDDDAAAARAMMSYLCDDLGISRNNCSNYLHKNKSTIVYAVKRHHKMNLTNKVYQNNWNEVRKSLGI